ncbi:RBBP9/YdeN family alpha/beta hydrolase [Cellvibrio mixtus]|uniref:RBBP9/YdeN family alpha/beta hydrolase n=1 Tax=Cellvibrio mixtus TaxID=39650 RepID=UPI000A048009|nr:alpha/beta hydrolase [Cellvibrio mixtus]
MSSVNSFFPQSLRDQPVLIVPGLRNSDEHHWQSLWEGKLPNSKRIELTDWDTPDLEKWKQGIREQLQNIDQPVVIIAHSFGTLASASIAEEFPEKIAALFLVAPADPDKFQIASQLPQHPLRVSAQIIASSNDPWLTEAKAAYWALLWGADYLRFKNVGHINSASNLGEWPEGIIQLQRLLRKANARRTALAQHKSKAA